MPQNYRKLIRLLHAKLQRDFALTEYDTELEFRNLPDNEDDLPTHTTTASTVVDTRYLNYTIYLFPLLREKYLKGQVLTVAQILVHEMLHVLLWPMHDLIENQKKELPQRFADEYIKLEEQLVERLSRLISTDRLYRSIKEAITEHEQTSKPKTKNRKKASNR